MLLVGSAGRSEISKNQHFLSTVQIRAELISALAS